MIVANNVSGAESAFQSDRNAVVILDRLGKKVSFERRDKRVLAGEIWNVIIERTKELKSHPITSHV